MIKSYIVDGDTKIEFYHSFSDVNKTAHENLCSPFMLQNFLREKKIMTVEEVIEWYKKNQYSLNLPMIGANYNDFQECWNKLRGNDRGNYFRYRCTTESYLSGIHLLKLVEGQSLIDIGCGIGHFSAFYKYLCSRTGAVDAELSNLLIMHRCFSDETSLICSDLNVSLGTSNEKYDNVFASDILHYIHNKKHFMKEIELMWNREGLLLFNHVHHCGQEMKEEGIGEPLKVLEWKELLTTHFPNTKIRMYGEHKFVRYVLGEIDNLLEATENETSPLVCIICDKNYEYDLRKQIVTPPVVQVNNAYELRVERGDLVFKKCKLPTEFNEEFETELFPTEYVVSGCSLPVNVLFARGILTAV